MQFEELEELIERMETTSDNAERQQIFKIVGPILDFHRQAFARVVEILREEKANEILDRITGDPLLEGLLRGYELIDLDLGARVQFALESARPLLLKHGGDVHLMRMRGRVAELEMTGSCHGCAASMTTLRNLIEKNLYDQVPELRGIEVAGITAPAAVENWLPLLHTYELHDGEWLKVQLFDVELVVCSMDAHPFVFENRCPAGGEPLDTDAFGNLSIACAPHGHRFDLRSGACVDDPRLRLRVYPSTVDDAVIRIAYEPDSVPVAG